MCGKTDSVHTQTVCTHRECVHTARACVCTRLRRDGESEKENEWVNSSGGQAEKKARARHRKKANKQPQQYIPGLAEVMGW